MTTNKRKAIAESEGPEQAFSLLKGLNYAEVPYDPSHDSTVATKHPDKKKANMWIVLLFGHHVLEITKRA